MAGFDDASQVSDVVFLPEQLNSVLRLCEKFLVLGLRQKFAAPAVFGHSSHAGVAARMCQRPCLESGMNHWLVETQCAPAESHSSRVSAGCFG